MNAKQPATTTKKRPIGWNTQQVIEFIKLWNSSTTVSQVAEETGRSLQSIYLKVQQCREKGVEMKQMSRSGPIKWDDVMKAEGIEKVTPSEQKQT